MNILIIRFSSFGDVVLSTAFVRAVRKKYPEANLYFLTKNSFAEVFENNPNLTKIYTFSDGKNFVNLLKNLKKQNKFDIVYDLSVNLKSLIASFLLGEKTFRVPKNVLQRRWIVATKNVKNPYKTIKQNYSYFLGFENIFETEVFLTDLEKLKAREILTYDDKKIYVGINTGAKWETKRWILQNYVDVIAKLNETNCCVVLFGDKNETEFNREIAKNFENSRDVFDLTNKLTKREFFATASLMNCFLTTDSAGLHIAQTFSIPTVAIFGPTVKNFGFWHAKQCDVLVESDMKCRPCSLHGNDFCREKHFMCMKNISAKQVLEAIFRIIKQEKL